MCVNRLNGCRQHASQLLRHELITNFKLGNGTVCKHNSAVVFSDWSHFVLCALNSAVGSGEISMVKCWARVCTSYIWWKRSCTLEITPLLKTFAQHYWNLKTLSEMKIIKCLLILQNKGCDVTPNFTLWLIPLILYWSCILLLHALHFTSIVRWNNIKAAINDIVGMQLFGNVFSVTYIWKWEIKAVFNGTVRMIYFETFAIFFRSWNFNEIFCRQLWS